MPLILGKLDKICKLLVVKFSSISSVIFFAQCILLTSCMEEPLPTNEIKRIETSPYIMAYPGSWWDYKNRNTGAVSQTHCTGYVKHSFFSREWQAQTDSVEVPVLGGVEIYYDSRLKSYYSGSSSYGTELYKLIGIPGSGNSISYGGFGSAAGNVTYAVFENDLDTLKVKGTLYQDIKHTRYYAYHYGTTTPSANKSGKLKRRKTQFNNHHLTPTFPIVPRFSNAACAS